MGHAPLSVLLLGLVLLQLAGVRAAQPAQNCTAQCQARQGSAVRRVLQGLLGPGLTMDVFTMPVMAGPVSYTNASVFGGLDTADMTAAGFPQHCLIPGANHIFVCMRTFLLRIHAKSGHLLS